MSKTKFRKKTLNLREGDWEKLQENYSPRGLQVSTVIRYLVSSHVDRILLDDADLDELTKEFSL